MKNKNLFSLVALIAIGGIFSPIQAASIKLDQGADWTELRRRQYYSVDQGSRLIKYKWIKALRQDNGEPFLAENLSRYGYLPNSARPDKLPIGFQVSADGWLGLTCSACHTRQIEVNGTEYRVDGGPALADFQYAGQEVGTVEP